MDSGEPARSVSATGRRFTCLFVEREAGGGKGLARPRTISDRLKLRRTIFKPEEAIAHQRDDGFVAAA